MRRTKLSRFRRISHPGNNEALNIFTLQGREYPAPYGMPNYVTVLGQRIAVRYHSKIYSTRTHKSRLRGCLLMTDRLIYIDPNFPQLMMRETLFHEMAHAYMDTINRRDLKSLTPEQIEGVCDLFATSMLDRDLQV